MSSGKIKVAYVAGTGKSGSTLLGKLLGQVEGVMDVGELINLDTQFARGERCGCGALVSDCELWSAVPQGAFGGMHQLDRRRWQRLKTRYLPLLLIPGARQWLPRHFEQLHRLHRSVWAQGQPRMIADSSKSAFYGAVLALAPDFQVYTLHLVRDVRASEGSMHRLKSQGIGKFARRSTWWNSLRWMLVNHLTEWAARWVGSPYLRIRYEDLVADPHGTLEKILRFTGEAPEGASFIDGSTALLRRTHSVAGSSVRFKQGAIELRLDERWREQLPETSRTVVDRLTRRFRSRYGY